MKILNGIFGSKSCYCDANLSSEVYSEDTIRGNWLSPWLFKKSIKYCSSWFVVPKTITKFPGSMYALNIFANTVSKPSPLKSYNINKSESTEKQNKWNIFYIIQK